MPSPAPPPLERPGRSQLFSFSGFEADSCPVPSARVGLYRPLSRTAEVRPAAVSQLPARRKPQAPPRDRRRGCRVQEPSLPPARASSAEASRPVRKTKPLQHTKKRRQGRPTRPHARDEHPCRPHGLPRPRIRGAGADRKTRLTGSNARADVRPASGKSAAARSRTWAVRRCPDRACCLRRSSDPASRQDSRTTRRSRRRRRR